MAFETGNSGNLLRHAVIKTGPGCQQEGAFCQYLGDTVAPRVYTLLPDGYVMEKLEIPNVNICLLRDIETKLRNNVWNRQSLPVSLDSDWRDALQKYGVVTPSWVKPSDPCLVHGDPTWSNALIRGGELILGDPRAPRDYIPQCKETDMARILQSWWGWEVYAYGAQSITFKAPDFVYDKDLMQQVTFWLGATAARIRYQEIERSKTLRANLMQSTHILQWCDKIRSLTNV